MQKYYYTPQEIEDFRKFLKITRKWPQERYFKIIDHWRKECARKDKLLKLCLECVLTAGVLVDLRDELEKEVLK